MDRATKSITGIGRITLANLKRLQFALLGVGATVAGFVTLSLKASEAQRMAMARLSAHAGKMGPAIAAMVEAISKQLGRDLGFSQSDIAKLATFIAEMTGRPALQMEIEAALVLARVKGMTPEEAASLINRVISGRGTEADKLILASLDLDASAFTNIASAATEIITKLRDKALELTPEFDKLDAAITNFLAALGGGGADSPFMQFIAGITGMIVKANDFVAAHPGFVTAMQAIALVVGIVALALGAVLIPAIIGATFALLGISIVPALIFAGLALLGVAIFLAITQWDELKKEFIDGFTEMKDWAVTAFKVLSDIFLFFFGDSLKVATAFIEALGAAFRIGFTVIKALLTGDMESLKQVFKDGLNWIVDKINAFIRMLNNIKIRIPVVHIPLDGSVGGGTVDFPQIPQLPKFQHGGVMGQGGVAMVGEAGPELVALPGGSRVFPNGQGAGAMGMTININGPVFGMPDLKRVIQEAVRDTLRGSGFSGLIR